jgi:hypothetical protein
MTPSSTTKLTLKLLIDTKNEKVLFAKASKPVVDFIFNILSLPMGTIVKLLGNNGMVGSIGNLYHSVENLNHNYMQQDQNKDVLLNPSAPRWSIEIAIDQSMLSVTTNNAEFLKFIMSISKLKFLRVSLLDTMVDWPVQY